MNRVFDPTRGISIPAGIAQCGAGKDAYLRKLKATCQCCGAQFALDTSDSPELCQHCFDIAGIENEIADGCATLDSRRDEIARLKAAIIAQCGHLKNLDL